MNPPQPPVDKTQNCVDTRRPDSTASSLLFRLLSGASVLLTLPVKKHWDEFWAVSMGFLWPSKVVFI